MSRDIVADIGTSVRTGRSGVRIPAEQVVFFFSITSRPALGPNQPPIRSLPAFVPGGEAGGA